MQRRGGGGAGTEVLGMPPVAEGVARRSGSLRLTWASPTLADVLGVSWTAAGRPRFDLDHADADRLRAVVGDLAAGSAQRASIEVGGLRGRVWLHLHGQRGTRRVVATTAGARQDRPVLVVADPAPALPSVAEDTDDRASVVSRLAIALLRLRRSPGAVAIAVSRVVAPRGAHGPTVGPELADRLRAAARDTDVVGRAGGDILVLVAEGTEPGGELAVGRRLTSFLQRQVPDDGEHGVQTVATAVTDPDVDPEGLLQHLVEQVRGPAAEHGLTVLPTWSTSGTTEDTATDARVRAALASGRFVLGGRRVRPAVDAPAGAATRDEPIHLVEVVTVDDGQFSPVRVAAPGLAAALDGWLLDRAGEIGSGRIAVRLQPGGTLTTGLGQQVAAVLARRPGLQLVLHVPEVRLAEALGAERTVLATLADTGAQLGVAGWTGHLPPTALVAHHVSLVELAADVPRSTLTAVGAASVAGLCAALRVATGSAAVVVADAPDSPEVALALAECGVWHHAPVDPVLLTPGRPAPEDRT